MPSRNVVKVDIADSYYHVYARGISRQMIFVDDADGQVFLSLLKRYLSIEPSRAPDRSVYPHFYASVELLAFCLMGNHFHLLFYQHEAGSLSHFMRCLMTSYSRYFNKKYDKSGPLLESRYKSSRISNDSYLTHISRYIHLNPKHWRTWQWSSLVYYLGKQNADWLRPNRILDLFISPLVYEDFLADYASHREMLDSIKHELAGS